MLCESIPLVQRQLAFPSYPTKQEHDKRVHLVGKGVAYRNKSMAETWPQCLLEFFVPKQKAMPHASLTTICQRDRLIAPVSFGEE